MHVGLISPPWIQVPPPAYGGTEAVVDRLARGLRAAGVDVLLAASSDSTCPVPLVPGLDHSQPGRIGETVPEMRHLIRSYAAMAEAGVDVVHDHTVAGPFLRHHAPAAAAVTTMHGPVLSEMGDIYRAMAASGVAVVAISHHQARTAPGIVAARVIHHGVDVAEIPVGAGTGGYVCFLGRLHPSKGAREAVLAARLAGVPIKVAGRIAGQAEEEYFRDAVAPLLGPGAEYVGEVGGADKLELLGAAIAMVNPITWPEPFGLVMIEALATGTPVLTTHQGSAPELIDDGVTGLLRDDVHALASALAEVQRLDRADCRRTAETRFSTRRMVADHLRLYSELLSGTGATATRTGAGFSLAR